MRKIIKNEIVQGVIRVCISIALLTVFVIVKENTEQITVDSNEYAIAVLSFLFGSLIGITSIPILFSAIKKSLKKKHTDNS